MREFRKVVEQITDKIMFLSLISLVSKYKQDLLIGDRIKCMKLPFLIEYPMFEDNIKGFNCLYFKYDHGPLSKDVYNIWWDLLATNYISFKNNNLIEITARGNELANDFIYEVLDTVINKYFYTKLDGVAKHFGILDTRAITSKVYDMEIYAQELNSRMKVKECPNGVTLTCILDTSEAEREIDVPQSWLETLSIALSPSNKKSLEEALNCYKDGKIFNHTEVWVSV